jgi:DNA-binding transcriptional MerR regulator
LTPLQQKQWSEEMVKQRAKAIAPEEQKALPVEMAARIGLAGKFLDEVPLIRERAAAGELSIGTGGSLQAYFNAYGPGELSRKIKSGTDALLRNLTGAGMPLEEAKKYVSRYEPQLLETSTSMLSKLDQLTDELRRIEENAYRGRGGLPQERIDARAAVAEAMAAIKQGRNKKMIMQRLKDTYGISFGDF